MGGFLVNPLINGLMANGELRVIDGEPPGDKFRGPSEANAFFDIAPNNVGFESWSPMGFVVAFICSLLGFVRQVIAGINRRGISLELPREGAGAPLENCGDLP